MLEQDVQFTLLQDEVGDVGFDQPLVQCFVGAEAIGHGGKNQGTAGVEIGQPQPCPDSVSVEHPAEHLAQCLGAFPAQCLSLALQVRQFQGRDGGYVPHGEHAQWLAPSLFGRDQVASDAAAERDGHRHTAAVTGRWVGS